MASNNGSKGLFAGADIFKPGKQAMSGPKGGGSYGGHKAPVKSVEKNQTARFAPDSLGRTVTARGQSGASNHGRGSTGASNVKTIKRSA